MRVPRLFINESLALDTPSLALPPTQSHYIRNVLRLRPGQALVLFNGEGGEFHGTITAIGRSVVTVRLERFDEEDRESRLRTQLGLAVTKRDAMDEALQKATELGVSEIVPVITEHNATTTRSLDKRVQHWGGVIRSAAEQCRRNRLPHLVSVTSLTDFVTAATAEIKLIAHPGDTPWSIKTPSPTSISLLCGPEGGFSEQEVTQACLAGFTPVSLGPRILRAETAPMVLLSLAQSRWGDLS